MRLLTAFLRIFFYLLYGPLAWSYDLVAAMVSLGRWRGWVGTVLPYVQGPRVLELGHGPGHLQHSLHAHLGGQDSLSATCIFGLDLSRQMSRQAAHRLHRSGYASINLIRGLAQALPLASNSFQSVISTFPSEYIFDSRTLAEGRRVLTPGGRMIVLPAAWITGQRLMERWAAGLFRLTGQAPQGAFETILDRLKRPFDEAGFQVTIQRMELDFSTLLVILAEKPYYS